MAPVGTATLGAGRWGQLDMVGETEVWALVLLIPRTFPFSATCAIRS